MESMPSPGFKGYRYPDIEPAGTSPSTPPSNALYAIKHNPFQLMTDIADKPKREKNIVPFTQLRTELKDNKVPNFAFITPNMIDDMHGQPPYTKTQQFLFNAGDNFVKNTVQEIMNSKSWKTSKSVIYITWDEAGYPSGPVTPSELQTFTAPGRMRQSFRRAMWMGMTGRVVRTVVEMSRSL